MNNATDTVLRARLLAGEHLIFDQNAPPPARQVPAALIAEAICAGLKVTIENAQIVGPLILKNASATNDIRLGGCHFADPLDCSCAVFERSLRLERCSFASVNFDSARFGGLVSLAQSVFRTPPLALRGTPINLFNDASFATALDAHAIELQRHAALSFDRVRLGGAASFHESRLFAPLSLSRISVSGALVLLRSLILGGLDLTAARIDGDLLLVEVRSGRRQTLDLRETKVCGSLNLASAQCRGTVALGATSIERLLVLANGRFKGLVSCYGASAGGLIASGARLHGGLELSSLHCGDLDLTRARVRGALSLRCAELSGWLDMSGARVRNDTKALELQGASIKKHLTLDNLWVAGDLDANAVSVGTQLSFVDARCDGKVDFGSAQVRQSVYLRGTHIGGSLNFSRADLGEDLSCGGLLVHGRTRFEAASIRALRLHADAAPYDHAARLLGGANFAHAHLGYLGAIGAQFGGPAAAKRRNPRRRQTAPPAPTETGWEHCEFTGVANFSRASLQCDASFYGAIFGKEVIFQRVLFAGAKPVSFSGAVFRARATFYHVRFEQGADFSYARFEQEAMFRARFGAAAQFMLCRFLGNADFSDADAGNWVSDESLWGDVERHPAASQFSRAAFVQTRFGGDARFDAAKFSDELDLRQADCASLHLPSATDLPARVGLGGCHYQQLKMRDPASLLVRGDGALRLAEYDRQPFGQLESCLRRSGDDATADAVYLAARRFERARKAWLPRCVDTAYGALVNYGVRPWRLAVFALLLSALGSAFFAQPGSVEPADKALRSTTPYTASWEEAISMGLSQFLPVSLPIKDQLVPAGKPILIRIGQASAVMIRPTTVASVLQLAGWILVPIGLAAMGGVLMRKKT